MTSLAETTLAVPVPAPRSWPAMRVCHVMSADLWAGAEVQVATIASYLVRQPDVHLTAVLLNDGRLACELRALGIEVAVVDEHRHTSAAIVASLVRFFRTHRVSILHTHRYKDTVLGTIAAKLAGVPKVVRTVHGLPEPLRGWDHLKFQAYGSLDRAALGCFADRIIAVSNDLANTLANAGYKRSAVIPIHNGINLWTARPGRDCRLVRRELGIDGNSLVIGTIGRLVPVKAHVNLLRAAQRILRRQPDTRFLIVGDGPLRGELAAMAAQLGVDHACLFTGARQDTFDVLAAMDVFALPSLHEGVPMALLEAMVLGKPVVATAVGGVPEIVQDHVSGRLIPPGDDAALADVCLAVASDRHMARSLGAAARRAVAERFSLDVSGRAVLDVYRSLLRVDSTIEPTSAADLGAAGLALELTRGLLRIARRRTVRVITHRSARHLMNRIRRNPARLIQALQSAKDILIVCHGNVIRSPFAAELLARGASGASVRITSGGVAAVSGNPPHPTALRIATARSIDLSRHASSLLDAETVASSDVIFVMDIPLLTTMRRRFPEARHKVFLLTCLAAKAPLEVRDPIDGDDSRFQACFDHISQAVGPIARTLREMAWAQ